MRSPPDRFGLHLIGLALPVCLALGCATTLPTGARVPDTAADPLPYAPPPVSEPNTAGVTAARATTEAVDAYQIARVFLEAAIRGDAATSDRLLAATPILIDTGRRGTERTESLRRVLFVSRLVARDRHELDYYIDVDNMQMTPADTVGAPGDLRPGDLFVTVPIRPAGRRAFSQFGESWAAGTGGLLIRESENIVLGF